MATATIQVSARVRNRWAMRVAPWMLRLRLRRLAMWAVARIRVEVRAGSRPWEEAGRLSAEPDGKGIVVKWRST